MTNSNNNPIKQYCLYGDICPFDDCEECSDFAPVDVNGEPGINFSQHKRIALEDWVQMMKEAMIDEW